MKLKLIIYKIKESFISLGYSSSINDIKIEKKKIIHINRAGGSVYHVKSQLFFKIIGFKYVFLYKIEKFFNLFFGYYLKLMAKKKGRSFGLFLNKNFEVIKFLFISIFEDNIYFLANLYMKKNIYYNNNINNFFLIMCNSSRNYTSLNVFKQT
ncbi:hypothetical protein ACWNYO_00720 [Candidatus Vidania fulgoroideorum]